MPSLRGVLRSLPWIITLAMAAACGQVWYLIIWSLIYRLLNIPLWSLDLSLFHKSLVILHMERQFNREIQRGQEYMRKMLYEKRIKWVYNDAPMIQCINPIDIDTRTSTLFVLTFLSRILRLVIKLPPTSITYWRCGLSSRNSRTDEHSHQIHEGCRKGYGQGIGIHGRR